jgi:acetolactate synthase-1/2/3 large subunit
MPRQHRVVDHIVEHLVRIEIDYIFGVDGANIEDLYDAAHFSSDITAVLAKHEFSATTMDGRGSFQDTSGRNGSLNAEALFSAVSVFCRRVLTPPTSFERCPAL